MQQNSPKLAIRALSEWWEDMGVAANQTEIQALLRASYAAAAPSAQTSEATLNAPASAPDGKKRTPNRRKTKARPVNAWIEEARSIAADAPSIQALRAAIEKFDGSPLKPLCEKTVVFDGTEGAPVMVIGEGPGGEEDRTGLPFVGKAGQLLDKMLSAIALDRTRNTFITNVNYWRPPGNRNPEADELAVCRPFVDRMVELGQPKLILAMGGVAAKSLLNTSTGITRLRGSEHLFETSGGVSVPVIPMFHPAYLLRRSADKSRAWRDLLLAQARLEEMGTDI